MGMHVEQTGHESLASSIDDLSVLRDAAGGGWTHRRYAFTLNDNGLVLPNGGLFGIKQAHMLDGHGMPGMRGQFGRQTRVTCVLSFAIEGIELIVPIFPAFSKECEPFARRGKEMLVIIQPNSLRIERKPSDPIFSHVHFSTMALDR